MRITNECSQIGRLQPLKGGEYLLDGYITYKTPKRITRDGSNYSFQCFQGDHADEYIVKKDGNVCLFHNGILKMYYQEEEENETQIGDFTQFENGCVAFVQSFDDIWDNRNCYRIVNHIQGERLEIYSYESGKRLYHGEFNEYREREGWGIEFDEKSGDMILEGIWKKNKLKEIIRKIEGTIMTEFKRNGDNTIVSNRIPVYTGEFVYDESKESFMRNGRGYWIDEETRIATRESVWSDGVEVSGRDLYDGWYTRSTKPIAEPESTFRPIYPPSSDPSKIYITGSMKLNEISTQVTDLTVSSNYCKDLNAVDLSKFKLLQSIEIGNDCFESVQIFKIDGLNQLKKLKIGINSFTQEKNSYGNDESKSFHLMNCESLEWLEIGEYSFSDFGGDFDLNSLPKLQEIKIGTIGAESYNFYGSSFTIRGINIY